MSLVEELHKGTNKDGVTANGAISNSSTLNAMLDFFSNAGAMRGREKEAIKLFHYAFAENKLAAIKALFYLRDIRGGQGERSVFRAILEDVNKNHPSITKAIVEYIPEYGRWDEVLLVLSGNDEEVTKLIKSQLEADEKNMKEGKSISLIAKWLPSVNASSSESRKAGLKIAKLLGLKESQYRKKLAALKKHMTLLEQKMSSKEWSDIDYSKIPSQAHRKHVKAFKRNDENRYENYLESVEKGESKINSGTMFTYEIYDMVNSGDNRTADAMWNALPDYTRGENALVLPDVSGSMWGRPMSISVSLAVYFAERNKGIFKDYFLEFSSTSKLHKLSGETIKDKLSSVENSTEWMGSTNLQSAFDAILEAAKKSNASEDEMPKILYIISDMQFNQATSQNRETNFEVAQRKFKDAGYEMPHVVFWNCNAWGTDAPATMYDNKVTLISGSNQSTFQYAVAGKTPIESMMDILNSERYAQIKI